MSASLVPVDLLGLEQSLVDTQGQLSPRSRGVYASDLRAFVRFLLLFDLQPSSLTRSHVILYREYLLTHYKSNATKARMIAVVRRVFQEEVTSGRIASSPFVGVKGFVVDDESPHIALTLNQSRLLLSSLDTSTLVGKRNHAILLFLLRTGVRRAECSALNIGDLKEDRGHTIAIIRHAKGNKRLIVKVPPDVLRDIRGYLEAAGRLNDSSDAPLFSQCDRWKSKHDRVSHKLIERAVKAGGRLIGLDELTPHCLRATFITLALEGGASLTKVQYSVGHADPRTTERYQRRKMNLDDNAVDYVKF